MVLCVDRDQSAAETTAKVIIAEGGQAEVCTADWTSSEDCRRVVETCLKKFKKLTYCIITSDPGLAQIVETRREAWEKTFDVNITGMFLMCQNAIPQMIQGGGGSIINVSTVASIRSFPDAAYSASKGAVNSLTIHIAGRYGRYNIRANCLVLGYIDTPLARPAWENTKVKEINLRQVPMRRFASPWEVATVAAFLASDEASYVTGAILPVDGGLSVSL